MRRRDEYKKNYNNRKAQTSGKMSRVVLNTTASPDALKRCIRPRAASGQKAPSPDVADAATAAPLAYIVIDGVTSLFLELPSAPGSLRTDIWQPTAAGALPLSQVLSLLITPRDEIMAKNAALDFLARGDRSFSVTRHKVAAMMFLSVDKQIRVVLVDPHDAWEFESLPGDLPATLAKSRLSEEERTQRPQPIITPDPIFPSFDPAGVAARIQVSSRIGVMIGAGVSTCPTPELGLPGIPDFRSANGLYSRLEKYQLPKPEALFTLDYFRDKPDLFYRVSEEMGLWPGDIPPTRCHFLLKLLEEQGKLALVLTQNIDCLERATGIHPDQIVEAHGSYATSSCIGRGKHPMPTDELRAIVATGAIPKCATCGEIVKPDVVFFGEGLPRKFFTAAEKMEMEIDLLLVIGTSLQVMPFASCALPPSPGNPYPRVLINMDRVGEFTLAGDKDAPADPALVSDVFLKGDCQKAAVEIAQHLGLGERLAELHAAAIDGVRKRRAAAAAAASA